MELGKQDDEDNTPVKPIPEKILSYYRNCVNDLFYNDGISYATQADFEIGYDESTNRITIPIRDENGILCGVKGRIFAEHLEDWEKEYKYLFI